MSGRGAQAPRRGGFPDGTAAFVALSLAAAVVPLAEIFQVLGRSDVLYVAAVLAFLLAVELVALRVLLAWVVPARADAWFGRAWLTLALIVNVASFLAPLLNARVFVLVLVPLIAGQVFWLLVPLAAARRGLVLFAGLFMLISIGKAGWSTATEPAYATQQRASAPSADRPPARSVYAFGFDALASSRGLATLFGVREHPTRAVLESLGFRAYDTFSAGEHTLSTFGRMFMLGDEFNHTIARTFFNGMRPVPLYDRLRAMGLRIQFLYATEYFGVDAHRIDYFYPNRATPYICEFVDVRYALFACRPWFRAAMERWLGIRLIARAIYAKRDDDVEFERIRARFAKAASDDARWFSFAHLWFPGHTALDYRFDDAVAADRYRARYLEQLEQVAIYARQLVASIRERDPNAVIVIFGDHGPGLTRGASVGDRFDGKPLTADVIELDRRGILLGIHPRDFCIERIGRMADSAPLLRAVLECLGEDR
jgi:hypothetical protein